MKPLKWCNPCKAARSGSGLSNELRVCGPLLFLTIFWALPAFIFLNSVPAHAEWRPISNAEGAGGFMIYVDPTTLHRTGDLVKMWVLYDFKFVQTSEGKSYLSATWQQQFDCAAERSRHLAYKYYSNNIGQGNVVVARDDQANKWSPVPPRSAAAILWNIVCGKGGIAS
ncbi:MAG TPA: surface-adhesin E family protein [Nitrospiraceae bacterium]